MIPRNFIKIDLCKLWLIMFICILHIYLIYQTIKDYMNIKSLSFDLLYGGEWSQGPMAFKLSCLLCSITFLPLIIITSVIITGNLANDGHVLGQDIDNNHFIIDSDSKGQIVLVDLYGTKKLQHNLFCRSHFIKQQFVPISIFLQILSGFCYLIPLPFIEYQKLEHKALGPNFLWHTDLDFIIDPDKIHDDFTSGEPFHLPMRPAYFNMIVCLILLSYRYPSVFWRTSRRFALLFYVLIIVLSLHILIDYSVACILIRLTVPGFVSNDLIPGLHPIVICFLSFSGSLILIVLQMTVFNYGITQYFSSLVEHRQTLRLQDKGPGIKKTTDNEECSNGSSDSAEQDLNDSVDDNGCPTLYNRYCTHFIAVVFSSLAMAMKAPMFIHQWRLYSRTGDRAMYLNIILAIIFSLLWLITWFAFTLNNKWKFKVNFRSKREDLLKKTNEASVGGITCSTLPTTANNILHNNNTLFGNTGSPVYATCHPVVPSLINRVGVTPNHQNNNQIQIDEGDLSSCYNYVLLHSANNASSATNNQNANVANYTSIIRQANTSREATSPTFINVDGNMINADELYGSEKSSESNFSRSLTAQERNRYALLPQDVSDGMLNRYLVNRYYSMDNPNTKRVPFVRSPLLSYQFSTESSPTDHNRRQSISQSQSKVTFTDQFIGTEPDLLTHKYSIGNARLDMDDLNPTLEKMRAEFLRTDSLVKQTHLKELSASSPTSNIETIVICNKRDLSPTNKMSVEINEFNDKLNGMGENNEEEERMCSQV